MSNIEGLKEQARRHEQKEEWRKALDLYNRAIERLAENDTPDIGLHNRVGDLYIRVGEIDLAVEAFERAVDHYVDAELPNNAIAVCKKILRNVPHRTEVFLRMGRVRADQGFVVDARSHFVAYAEGKQAAGDIDEALRALMEFADAVKDDTAIRLAIAEHLEQHDRADEAVDQLVEGYRSAARQGLDDEVATFRRRLEELRPGMDPDAADADDADADDAGADELRAGLQADDDDAEHAWGIAPAGDDFAIESTSLVDESDDGYATAAESVADAMEDSASFDVFADDHEVRDDTVDAVVAAEPTAAPDPTFGFGFDDYGRDAPGTVAPASASDDGVTAPVDERHREPGAEEPIADAFGEDEVPLDSFDDAISSIGPDVSGFAPRTDDFNPLAGLDVVGSEEEEEDDDEPVELPYLHRPEGETVVHRLEVADPDNLADRIAGSPDDLDLRQRAVEFAHRSGDEVALATAYIGLAGALRRTGDEVRARAVYRQALQLDPDHPEARAALAVAGGQVAEPVVEVASNEDYVDLGALILGDDDEKTTRFVVAYEEPSGDEQADFARMLTQFKAKVAQNVDADDVKAHHDLGTAYKEMGLLDEAVEEFQAALRASADHLPTYEMLGQAFLESGTPGAALRVLNRALAVPYEVEDELLGIYYTLARTHEEMGNTGDAREFYERIFSLDINFADVTERLRALR